MQIIISTTTALAINDAVANTLSEIGIGETDHTVSTVDFTNNENVNYSSNVVGNNVVIEINDELFFKYAAMYMSIAKIVAPFIKPIMSLLAVVKTDLKDIERFMNVKK